MMIGPDVPAAATTLRVPPGPTDTDAAPVQLLADVEMIDGCAPVPPKRTSHPVWRTPPAGAEP
ncbi:hypothetical protein [Janibacter melonis]|uniref:hypothetical protein n=1 Tax=Janibacter melonis TaxID=262209 RepID=UPI001918D264|nr:hypothetical protein [Janibacter melonis]